MVIKQMKTFKDILLFLAILATIYIIGYQTTIEIQKDKEVSFILKTFFSFIIGIAVIAGFVLISIFSLFIFKVIKFITK